MAPSSAASAAPAAWLCTHPRTAFCPKCLPPDTTPEKPKVDVIPFNRHLADLGSLCRFKHAPTVRCAMCLPPQQPSYKHTPDCDRGHLPYPRGSCPKCAPANAVLRPQRWRYVDGIALPAAAVQHCYVTWSRENQRGVQRAWLLYGKVIDDKDDVENPGARRAVVAAVFEPQQKKHKDRVEVGLGADQADFERVMGWLGLELVGWLFTAAGRDEGEKYGGRVVLTGHEVVTGAKLQQRARRPLEPEAPDGFCLSEVVTVCLEHGADIEPRAYMISDQGVALVRDGAVSVSPADGNMLLTPSPTPSAPAATIVYHDRPLPPGTEFLPDQLLVKVRTMATSPAHTLFAHHDFPTPRDADKLTVKAFLKAHKAEPWLTRISDPNLLAALAGFLEEKLIRALCVAVASRQLCADLATELSMQLYKQELIDFD